MDRYALNNLLSEIRWQTLRLSAVGKLGFGLMVLSIVFFLAAVWPQYETLDQAQAKVTLLQQQSQRDASQPIQLDDNQTIQVFYDSFPNVDSSPYWVKEIDAVAKKRGVELHGSDYRLVSDKGSKLARYEMILPVRGSYPQIRAFIADMLVTIPAVALVDMIIKREDIKSGRLEVRLSLNLYLNQ